MKTAEEILKANEATAEGIYKAMEQYAKQSKFCSCSGKIKVQVSHCAECGGIMDISEPYNEAITRKIYFAIDDTKKTFQLVDKTVVSILSSNIKVVVYHAVDRYKKITELEKKGYTQIK